MTKGDQVEKKRLDRVKSKEEVLRTLVTKDSKTALEELMKDPKSYLKQRISTVMVDIVKGSRVKKSQRNSYQRSNSHRAS
jgi:hypothetical protein